MLPPSLPRDARLLLTGVAGFIGFHLARRLLADGHRVVGLDNLNDYYDPGLKRARLDELYGDGGFQFVRADLADREATASLFSEIEPTHVLHMAAQAGVRYSLEAPFAYADSNLDGFLSILEGCRACGVQHLVYASSSSVYGANTRTPFRVEDSVDHPISLYAATKKANELMAHTYSHLYHIPVTGLRFFTVYGPWGRPDMAYYKFALKIAKGDPIDIYNHGQMQRDFTYIDDIVESVVRIAGVIPTPDPTWSSEAPSPASSAAPYRLYNIGGAQPVGLLEMVDTLERLLGRATQRHMLPMQPGEVPITYADTAALEAVTGYTPSTPLAEGLSHFVAWFREYHRDLMPEGGALTPP